VFEQRSDSRRIALVELVEEVVIVVVGSSGSSSSSSGSSSSSKQLFSNKLVSRVSNILDFCFSPTLNSSCVRCIGSTECRSGGSE